MHCVCGALSLAVSLQAPPWLDSSTAVVVLVNRDTRSAAEVVSAAVQDNDRGVCVLERRLL